MRPSCVSSQSTCSSSPTQDLARAAPRVALSPLSRQSVIAVVQALDRAVLELEVALELLGHGLADVELVEALQVRQALEEEDALDEPLGVLHLVDRLGAALRGERVVAPVLAHLRVQEVLVDRDELAGEHLVQQRR